VGARLAREKGLDGARVGGSHSANREGLGAKEWKDVAPIRQGGDGLISTPGGRQVGGGEEAGIEQYLSRLTGDGERRRNSWFGPVQGGSPALPGEERKVFLLGDLGGTEGRVEVLGKEGSGLGPLYLRPLRQSGGEKWRLRGVVLH